MLSLLVLTWSAWCLTGHAVEAPPSLDELLKEYRKHELPMPPPEAKLVRYLSFDSGISVTNGKLDPRIRVYSLAFLIQSVFAN